MNSLRFGNSLDIQKMINRSDCADTSNRVLSQESTMSSTALGKVTSRNTSSTYLNHKSNESTQKSGGSVTRPKTAVQSVGYIGKSRDFKRSVSSSSLKAKRKMADIEKDINSLVNKSLQFLDENKKSEGLEMAKEASLKENNLENIYDFSKVDYNYQLKFLVLINLCGHYEANKMLTDALELYDKIVKNEQFVSGYRCLLNMGNIYYQQKHFTKSLKMYQILLDKIPRKDKSFRLKVLHNYTIILIKNGKFQDAITNLQYMLQESKTDHKIAYHLLLIYVIIGSETDLLKQTLEMLILIPFKSTNNHFTEYELKRKEKIEKYILTGSKLVLGKVPVTDHFDWLIQIFKKSDFKNLLNHIEIFKVILLIKNGHVKTALESLKMFDEKTSLPPAVTLSLSFLYYSLGNIKKAEKCAQTTLESKSGTNREQSGAFNNLGVCQLQKSDYEMAREYFLQSLRLCNNMVEPTFNLGLIYKETEQYEQALFNLQVIDDSFGPMANILCQKGQIFEALQDLDAASECYQQLLALVPTDSRVLQKLGELAAFENDKKRSLQYFLDAYHYLPSNMENLKNLATHYMVSTEMIDTAVTYFAKAVQFEPLQIDWYFEIGECYRKSGNLYKSLQFYQHILSKFNDHVQCLRSLIELCSILGKHQLQDEYQMTLKTVLRSASVRIRTAGLSTAAVTPSQFSTKAFERSTFDCSYPSDTDDNDTNIINFDKDSDDLSFSNILPE